MSTWNKLNALKNGQEIFNHGYAQCVALVNYYTEDLLKLPFMPVNSAFELWTKRNQLAAIAKNYRQVGSPVAGAVFVSKGGVYDATHGHTGVVLSVNANGTFNTIEQNAGSRGVSRHTRNMSNILGFLVPHNNPAPQGSSGGGGSTYTVQRGDTLSGIAARFGTTWQELARVNSIANPNVIHAGLVLNVGKSARTYTVQRGDTLSGIAARFGTTWQELARVNSIANPNVIHAGLVLNV